MSLTMKVLTGLLSMRQKNLRSADAIARRVATRPTDASIPTSLRRKCTIERTVLDGMPVITLTPREGGVKTRVLYLHGGAYVNSLAGAHWEIISILIARSGATITVPLYPLAPECSASEAFPPLRALLDQLQATGSSVVLAGDSAGGGLAISLAIQIRNAASAPPTALLLFSPWLDVTMANPGISALEARDPMLAAAGLVWCGRQWAGSLPTSDPKISPIFDDLHNLPPMYIYQGGKDIFLPDAEIFSTKAHAAGSSCQLHVYPDGFHVFVGATFTPESRRALKHASLVINSTGDLTHPVAPI